MAPPNINSAVALGLLLLASSAPQPARADGVGIIGFGKTMYNPACAFACRSVVARCRLSCSSVEDGPDGPSTSTSPSCFTSDQSFLQTMAICIDNYCPSNGNPPLSRVEDYWAGHLGTGSVADYSYKPAMSFSAALVAGRREEADVGRGRNHTAAGANDGHQHRRRAQDGLLVARHGGHGSDDNANLPTHDPRSSLPIIRSRKPLNTTSFITETDWRSQYNGLTSFETNEKGHSTFGVTIAIVSVLLPVFVSLLRFIPSVNRSRTWVWIKSVIIYPPLWGSKHREPVARLAGGGFVPTRGQGLYILLISILNIVFLVTPFHTVQPQSIFSSLREQEVSIIGNRAAVLAMGNVVALFLFSTRNNILLYLTDWSYDTFLLLHRVFGYWVIFLSCLHSIMLLCYYKFFGNYEAQLARPYWSWGIVATIMAVAIWPASVLAVRQKAYELFLSTHHLFVVFFIVGYYYHIYLLYNTRWGYEIWIFVAIAIWGAERVFRLVRIALMGWRTATVSVMDPEREYLRVDIDGVFARGVVYLYFPTLTWRFWENHPFSVASSFSSPPAKLAQSADDEAAAAQDSEKTTQVEDGTGTPTTKYEDVGRNLVARSNSSSSSPPVQTRATVVIRTRTSMTARLAARIASVGVPIKLPVLVEGSYNAAIPNDLAQCTTLLCVAGGVGISAVMPLLMEHGSRRSRLFWGMRNSILLDTFSAELAALPESVQVETSVGPRLRIFDILRDELTCEAQDKGPIGIVVCGPPGMADDVRHAVTSLGQQGLIRRGVILLDEAFSW